MNGTQLRKKLARETNLTQKESARILESLTDIIKTELVEGNAVTLMGFGRFYTTEYKRKLIKTPDGESFKVKPHQVIRFKPAKSFKEAVSEN